MLHVVEGDRLLQMTTGRHEFSPQEGDRAPRHMGFQKQVRVLGALRQTRELFRQLARGLELPPPSVKPV